MSKHPDFADTTIDSRVLLFPFEANTLRPATSRTVNHRAPPKPPAPIPFPDLSDQAVEHIARQSAVFREETRILAAVQAATESGRQEGEQAGYVKGTHVGMWIGGVLGCIGSGVTVWVVYAIRAWAAHL